MKRAMDNRVIITTVPFGNVDPTSLRLLAEAGIEAVINPKNRKLRPTEVHEVIDGFPVVIAGTEPITAEIIAACPNLKAICRVGIGLDSVDLCAARDRGIIVSYTPDAPSAAVGELTIGLIIDLLRGIAIADRGMRAGRWDRTTGARIATSTVGVLGVGRIGSLVIRHLQGGFPGVRILAHDIAPKQRLNGVEWVDKETLCRESDVITIHVPLMADTLDLIGERELVTMKPTAVLVNTARGGIVNEQDLAQALTRNTIRAAAIDVFTEEPYTGPLANIANAVLTCHMGSMTADCRARMEVEATREAIRFLRGLQLESAVPAEEFKIAERFQRAR